MGAEQLLRKLGATGNLKGFRYAVHMIELAIENPDAVLHLNKDLYSVAAKRFHVSVSSVDRNLRTIVHVCWKRGNRTFLDEIAGVHLVIQPTNGMFLDIAASYLRREKKA